MMLLYPGHAGFFLQILQKPAPNMTCGAGTDIFHSEGTNLNKPII